MEKTKLIVFKNIKDLGEKVNYNLMKLNNTDQSFITPIEEVRFQSGDGKVVIKDTIREKDIFILSDVHNCSLTYNMRGIINHMSPDDHMQDIKRLLSALRNQPKRVTLITPFLYSSRQHKRTGNESMDCASNLRELEKMGVDLFVTIDAHEPSIGPNALDVCFENFFPTNLIIESFLKEEEINLNKTMIISPDTGAIGRTKYYANLLKCNIGFFYKQRDLTKTVNGKNPILGYKYIGNKVKGKDIIIVDDMISSGESMLEVATELKKKGANQIYLFSTFSLFTDGIEKFDKAYNEGIFNKLYTTNLTYIEKEITNKSWCNVVDCSILLARIINNLSKHEPLREIYDEIPKILIKK